jgi:hypothetical protein
MSGPRFTVGPGKTLTDLTVIVLVHAPFDATREYVPELPVVTFGIRIFCAEEVKEFGPNH